VSSGGRPRVGPSRQGHARLLVRYAVRAEEYKQLVCRHSEALTLELEGGSGVLLGERRSRSHHEQSGSLRSTGLYSCPGGSGLYNYATGTSIRRVGGGEGDERKGQYTPSFDLWCSGNSEGLLLD
jgi:hypothetical protein